MNPYWVTTGIFEVSERFFMYTFEFFCLFSVSLVEYNSILVIYIGCLKDLTNILPVFHVCLLFLIDEYPNNTQGMFPLTLSDLPSQECWLILFAATVMCIKSVFACSAIHVMGFHK